MSALAGVRPLRIGIALGAGSAAALAEIGALQVLREAGLPVHAVAGTSAGSVVGAAFAAGRLTELHEALTGLSRSQVVRLFDWAWPREGFLHGRRALEYLAPHLGERIEELDLPFAAIATDLERGDEVRLTRGPVFDAVRASIAIPGIFRPWRIDGRLLVDGGLVNPVPVSACRELGCEFVIAMNALRLRPEFEVAAGSPHPDADASEAAAPETPEPGLLDVVARASDILAARIASSRLREDPPGFLLQIPVPDVGMFDLHRTAELVEAGRSAASAALPGLRDALARAVPLHRRLFGWPRRSGSRAQLAS